MRDRDKPQENLNSRKHTEGYGNRGGWEEMGDGH